METEAYFPITCFLCSTPQWYNSSSTFCSDCPCWVIEYSTVGGNVSWTSRLMSLLASSAFNSLDSILSVMLPSSLDNWVKRLLPLDKESMINSFHLPSNASMASLIANTLFGHPSRVNIDLMIE